jgi:hypothetical protein
MKRSKIQLIIAVIIFVVGVSALSVYIDQTTRSASNQTQTMKESAKKPIAGRTEITYQARPGITSLAQLKEEASDVITTKSKYGELVESIEGHKGGTDGKYWSFYVNGEMAQVGAGDYIQQKGDLITWKFQKI